MLMKIVGLDHTFMVSSLALKASSTVTLLLLLATALKVHQLGKRCNRSTGHTLTEVPTFSSSLTLIASSIIAASLLLAVVVVSRHDADDDLAG